MTANSSQPTVDFTFYVKILCIVFIVVLLSACGTDNLWQGGEVKTRAATERNAVAIDMNKDQNREIQDRLDALEGLYIDLMREVKQQNQHVKEMTQLMSARQQQDIDAAKLEKLENSVRLLEGKMNQTISRISKTEMFLGKSSSAAQTQKKAEVENVASGNGRFAAQLGSFRTDDQVKAAWERYKGKYSAQLSNYKAVKSTFEDPTLGTMMYLLVGPFNSRADVNGFCSSLKASGETFCNVSDYKGTVIQ